MTRQPTPERPRNPPQKPTDRQPELRRDAPMIDDVPPVLLLLSVALSGVGFLLAYLFLPPVQSLCADVLLLIAVPTSTYTLKQFRRAVWPLWLNSVTCVYLYNLPARYAEQCTPPWARWPVAEHPGDPDSRVNAAASEDVASDLA